MKFNWKKLARWKIGFTLWDIHVVKQYPKKFTKDKESKDSIAVCDEETKCIYMLPMCISSPEFFLENLWHEIIHAKKFQDSQGYVDMMRGVLDCEEQVELFDDFIVDQESFSDLNFIFDNIENYQYILNYFKERKNGRKK